MSRVKEILYYMLAPPYRLFLRVMRAPAPLYRWFLRRLGGRASMPLRRASWRLVSGRIGAFVLRRRSEPVQLVLLVWGADEPALRAAAENSGVQPGELLVVTDCCQFSGLHRAGIAVEYVPPAGDLAKVTPGLDATAWRERRVQFVLDAYAHERVAVAETANSHGLNTLPADDRELDRT